MPDCEFEYDPEKSAANLVKHGIDFEQAQALWDDECAIRGHARFAGEDRLLLIGKLAGKHWTAVFTRRGERTRIISVRRSRSIEAMAYDEKENQR